MVVRSAPAQNAAGGALKPPSRTPARNSRGSGSRLANAAAGRSPSGRAVRTGRAAGMRSVELLTHGAVQLVGLAAESAGAVDRQLHQLPRRCSQRLFAMPAIDGCSMHQRRRAAGWGAPIALTSPGGSAPPPPPQVVLALARQGGHLHVMMRASISHTPPARMRRARSADALWCSATRSFRMRAGRAFVPSKVDHRRLPRKVVLLSIAGRCGWPCALSTGHTSAIGRSMTMPPEWMPGAAAGCGIASGRSPARDAHAVGLPGPGLDLLAPRGPLAWREARRGPCHAPRCAPVDDVMTQAA